MIVTKTAPTFQPLLAAPLRVVVGGRVSSQSATLDGFLGWYSRHFDLVGSFESVKDGRVAERVKVPLPTLLLAVVVGFWIGLESLHQLEDRLRHNPGLSAFLKRRTSYGDSFCESTVGETFGKLNFEDVRRLLHLQGLRGIKQWGARYHQDCELAGRLRPVQAGHLCAKLVVAIDGHEIFSSTKRCCKDCRVRTKTVERNGKKEKLTEYYHSIVVAHHVGSHPGLVLDFEPVRPGKGELSTAYKLLARLGKLYGDAIGIVLADALYDCGPWRTLARKQGYRMVHAQKDKRRDPGRSARRALDQRDPERRHPDWTYTDTRSGEVYAVWEQPIAEGERRYVESVRKSRNGTVHKATLLTDLPKDRANAVAVAILYEARWWIENQAFHELAGQWSLDHAFVHQGRPQAAWTFVALAILAFNAMQVYVYRHLHRQPGNKPRSILAYRADLRESMILCSRNRRSALEDFECARGP